MTGPSVGDAPFGVGEQLPFVPGAIALVTGGARGIGRSTAVLLARHGLTVWVTSRYKDGADDTARAIRRAGGCAEAFAVDLTDPDAVSSLFRELGDVPRYLVNNAGPGSVEPLTFDQGIAETIGTVARVTEAWAAAGPPEGASVVNIASVAGTVTGAGSSWYAAGKSAIAGYTRQAAVRFAGRIRVNAVAPGSIATDRLARALQDGTVDRYFAESPARRPGTPAEVAWPAAFLLSEAAAYINGHVLVVDGAHSLRQ